MVELPPDVEGWRWSDDELDALGAELGLLIADVLKTQAHGHAMTWPPHAAVTRWQDEPVPRAGARALEVLRRFAQEIQPYPFGNAHPRFSAWVNSPPDPLGVAGAALAAAMNPSVAGGNHAGVHVEHEVVRWFVELVGWDAGAGGLMVSGGSAATLTALATARHRALRGAGRDDRTEGLVGAPSLRLYTSSEAHSCVTKAVEALGLGSAQLVRVPARADATLDPDRLDEALRRDEESGVVPVAVVASVGTVNTGAVDPLAAIAEVAEAHDVWLHVDGAYGGPAVLLLDRWSEVRAALRRCDSLALDPHKWLYTPVDAGLVLFRNSEAARDTFSLVPPYLRTGGAEDEPVWFSEYGLEQTRPFRALKVWMQLQHLGLDGYRDLVARDVAVAQAFRDRVVTAPDFELLGHGLSVVCFRHRQPDKDVGELDQHNQRLLARLQAAGHAFVAGTTVAGRFALRACIVNPTTTIADLDFLLGELRRLAGAPHRT